MQFYSEGFFGYGEKGNYIPYSWDFFIPIAILIALSALLIIYRKQIRNFKKEQTVRFIIGFIIIIVEMSYYWRILYVGDEAGKPDLLSKLPIQLCEWGAICAAFMIMSLNDTLFGINYFVTFMGAGIALFVPQTVITYTGPTYYRYYQFWLEHILPILATIYVAAVHKKKPRYRDIWIAYGMIVLLAIPATIANFAIPEANYLYVRQDIPFIPNNYPIRVAAYSVIVLILFHILYGGWKLGEKMTGKAHMTQKES